MYVLDDLRAFCDMARFHKREVRLVPPTYGMKQLDEDGNTVNFTRVNDYWLVNDFDLALLGGVVYTLVNSVWVAIGNTHYIHCKTPADAVFCYNVSVAGLDGKELEVPPPHFGASLRCSEKVAKRFATFPFLFNLPVDGGGYNYVDIDKSPNSHLLVWDFYDGAPAFRRIYGKPYLPDGALLYYANNHGEVVYSMAYEGRVYKVCSAALECNHVTFPMFWQALRYPPRFVIDDYIED